MQLTSYINSLFIIHVCRKYAASVVPNEILCRKAVFTFFVCCVFLDLDALSVRRTIEISLPKFENAFWFDDYTGLNPFSDKI